MPLINKYYSLIKNSLSSSCPLLFFKLNRRKSIIKFFIAGGLAAAVDLILLYLFHGVFIWGLVVSTSLAFIISFVVSFALQKFWTFRNYDQKKITKQIALYMFNAAIGLTVNGLLMHLLVNNWKVWYLLAQIGVTFLIGLFNFIVYKFIIFKIHKNEVYCSDQTTTRGARELA